MAAALARVGSRVASAGSGGTLAAALLVFFIAPSTLCGFSYQEHRRTSNWALALAISCLEDRDCNPQPLTKGEFVEEIELLWSFLRCEPEFGGGPPQAKKVPCSLMDRRDPHRVRPRFSRRTFGDIVALTDQVGAVQYPFLVQIGKFEEADGGQRRIGNAAEGIKWSGVDGLSTRTGLSKKVDAMHSNVNHFQGDAITAFRRSHSDTTALVASGHLSLVEGMMRTATALHYLQDVHAPGHIVTARSDMHDIAANALHDRANALGLRFCLGAQPGALDDPFADRWEDDLAALSEVLASRTPTWLDAYSDCPTDRSAGADSVCLSAVRHLDNRSAGAAEFLQRPKRQEKERRELEKRRSRILSADKAMLEHLPAQLELLKRQTLGEARADCLVFRGDRDLLQGDAQLAYLTLVSARAVLDTLVSYRNGSVENSFRRFSWSPLSKETPKADDLQAISVYLNYGWFDFEGKVDGGRQDDPSLRPADMLILSVRGQTLVGGAADELRPEYRVEFPIRYRRPRTAVVIKRPGIETEAARKKGLQFAGSPFVVAGYSFTGGDGYQSHGAIVRGGVYWRRLSGQVSLQAGARYFDLRKGSSWRPLLGAQVEWGYSLFKLSLGLSRDYRPSPAGALEHGNSVDFGISFYLPRRRLGKMLGPKRSAGE